MLQFSSGRKSIPRVQCGYKFWKLKYQCFHLQKKIKFLLCKLIDSFWHFSRNEILSIQQTLELGGLRGGNFSIAYIATARYWRFRQYSEKNFAIYSPSPAYTACSKIFATEPRIFLLSLYAAKSKFPPLSSSLIVSHQEWAQITEISFKSGITLEKQARINLRITNQLLKS